MRLRKGDTVWVRLERLEGGARAQAGNDALPLTECVVAQVDVCGVRGCYGLEYADTRRPVGLPFFEHCFEQVRCGRCLGDGLCFKPGAPLHTTMPCPCQTQSAARE